MNEKWFSISIAETEKKLKTNAASGLSRKAARSAWYRTERGRAPLFIKKKKSAGKMLCDVIADFALVILMMAALFAVLFDERAVGVTVLLISVISIFLCFVFYCRAQRTMEQLDLYFFPLVKVIRGGKLYKTTFENIVPGDVILLEKGDVVCADARLVTSDKLRVSMRVEKNKYVSLRKQALGVISPDEKDPSKMSNIVHAGSVVLDGSARAIVYAVGGFTYLGALTGGIEQTYNDNIPRELKKLKKICSQVNMVSMLCVLPFSILSLLLSKMSGGTATLSSAFLTALAICASSMTQLVYTVCKVFFIKKIEDISKGKNAAVIRTTDAFDKLSDIDYLFMLDGSAVTDGILHFDTAFTVEGEMKSFSTPTPTLSSLYEMAAVYTLAEANSLTLGISVPQRFNNGIGEFIKKGNYDAEAVKIKFPIKSYMPGTDTQPIDRVLYTQAGKTMVLDVSRTDTIFSQCSHAIVGGKIQPLSRVGADKLSHTQNIHTAKGKTVLVFTVSSIEANGGHNGKVFVGAIVLREGVDRRALGAIATLGSKGIKVVSFINSSAQTGAPQIPVELQGGVRVSKDDFLQKKLPIDHLLGEIDSYYGFSESDIEELIKSAKARNATVGVICFSDFAADAIKNADVFISCSPIIDVFSAKNEQELYELELAGAASSSSCIQTVKKRSDVIIQRPSEKGGGLPSLVRILSSAHIAYRNLSSFFRYTLCAQFLRILMVCLPMAFGKPILDARHVILCSFIVDVFVLLMFAWDKTPTGSLGYEKYRIYSLRTHIKADSKILFSIILSSLVAIFMPIIMELIGTFGNYLYRVEFLLNSMLWMHILLCYYVRFKTMLNIKAALKSKMFVGLVIATALFILLTFTVSPFGLYFGIESNTLPYFLASFAAPVIFIISNELCSHIFIFNRKHKHAKKQK